MKGCIRTTVHHGRMSPLDNTTQIDEGQIATFRFEQEVDGVFACVRKERQMSRAGTPIPHCRVARQHGNDPCARVS